MEPCDVLFRQVQGFRSMSEPYKCYKKLSNGKWRRVDCPPGQPGITSRERNKVFKNIEDYVTKAQPLECKCRKCDCIALFNKPDPKTKWSDAEFSDTFGHSVHIFFKRYGIEYKKVYWLTVQYEYKIKIERGKGICWPKEGVKLAMKDPKELRTVETFIRNQRGHA